MRRRLRAVTLLEVLVALGFLSLAYIGGVQLMGHSLRLSERAEMRRLLTEAALIELEHLRAEVSIHPTYRPDHVRLLPGRRIRVRSTTEAGHEEPLTAICVTSEALQTDPPFSVTLTGWVRRP